MIRSGPSSPLVKTGDKVEPGAILGEVQETNIVHKVMLPPNVKAGTVKTIKSGDFTVDEIDLYPR